MLTIVGKLFFKLIIVLYWLDANGPPYVKHGIKTVTAKVREGLEYIYIT